MAKLPGLTRKRLSCDMTLWKIVRRCVTADGTQILLSQWDKTKRPGPVVTYEVGKRASTRGYGFAVWQRFHEFVHVLRKETLPISILECVVPKKNVIISEKGTFELRVFSFIPVAEYPVYQSERGLVIRTNAYLREGKRAEEMPSDKLYMSYLSQIPEIEHHQLIHVEVPLEDVFEKACVTRGLRLWPEKIPSILI